MTQNSQELHFKCPGSSRQDKRIHNEQNQMYISELGIKKKKKRSINDIKEEIQEARSRKQSEHIRKLLYTYI